MRNNQKSTSLTQQDIDDLTLDLESLQDHITQFFTQREQGTIAPQTIRMILQLANHLIDFYDE